MRTAETIMTRAVLTFAPDTLVPDAIAMLESHEVSGAPVVGEDGALLGVVSYKDLVRAVDPTAKGAADFYLRWPAALAALHRIEGHVDLRVEYVMTSEPISIERTAPLAEVAELMLEHGVHRVLVTDRGALVGIVSALDFVKLYALGG